MEALDCSPGRNPVLLVHGISAYWPFWLVCIGGVVLAVIALLALLLLTGKQDFPTTIRKNLPFIREKSDGSPEERPEEARAQIQFVRIGRYPSEKCTEIFENQWLTVGKTADFILDAADRKLADVHFRICLCRDRLLVSAVEGETFVNGVPIRELGPVPMASGEQLRAGGYEYRVTVLPGKGSERFT